MRPRLQVRTAVGDYRDPSSLLAQKLVKPSSRCTGTITARTRTAAARLGGPASGPPSMHACGAGAASGRPATVAAAVRAAASGSPPPGVASDPQPRPAPTPEEAVRTLEEEFDLREWRGEAHLITVEAERTLTAQAASMLRRLARDGGSLVLRDQVRGAARLGGCPPVHVHVRHTGSPWARRHASVIDRGVDVTGIGRGWCVSGLHESRALGAPTECGFVRHRLLCVKGRLVMCQMVAVQRPMVDITGPRCVSASSSGNDDAAGV